MKVEFHEDARLEFREAAHYYDLCEPALGIDFTEEVERTVTRIAHSPEVFPPFGNHTQRA